MAYNPGKNITPWYVGEKNSIIRGLEKKNSYPNQITHTPLKSQMVVPLVRFSRLVR